MICAWCKSDIDNDSYHCDQCGKEQFICPACGKPGKGKSCVEDGNPLFSPKQKVNGGGAAPASAPQNISLFGQPDTPSAPMQQPMAAAPTPQPPVAPSPIPQSPLPQSPIPQSPLPQSPLPQSPIPQSPLPQQPPPVMMQPNSLPFMKSQVNVSAQANNAMPGLKLINQHLNVDLDIKDGAIIGRSTGDYVAIFSQFSQISSRHMQFTFDKLYGWSVTDLGSTNGVALNTQPNWQNVAKLSPNIPVPIRDNGFILLANIEFQLKIIPAQSTTAGTVRL